MPSAPWTSLQERAAPIAKEDEYGANARQVDQGLEPLSKAIGEKGMLDEVAILGRVRPERPRSV